MNVMCQILTCDSCVKLCPGERRLRKKLEDIYYNFRERLYVGLESETENNDGPEKDNDDDTVASPSPMIAATDSRGDT